jgi:hypothetical protein
MRETLNLETLRLDLEGFSKSMVLGKIPSTLVSWDLSVKV